MTLPDLAQYGREVALSLRIGATPSSKLRLVQNTLQFHLANLRGRSGPQPATAAERYRIRVGGQVRDVWLRTYTGDIFIFHEVFQTRCYALPPQFAAQPRVVVDLGAHVGLTTLFWYGLFGPATYVCVEPNPANVALLERNVAGLPNEVHVVAGAIADAPGRAAFNPGRWSWGGHLDRGAAAAYEVRCVSMHEIMRDLGLDWIDLLKVDVENGVEALFGRNNAWLARVGTIVAELWPGYGVAELERDVAPYGFQVLPGGSPYGNSMIMAVRHARQAAQGTATAAGVYHGRSGEPAGTELLSAAGVEDHGTTQ